MANMLKKNNNNNVSSSLLCRCSFGLVTQSFIGRREGGKTVWLDQTVSALEAVHASALVQHPSESTNSILTVQSCLI